MEENNLFTGEPPPGTRSDYYQRTELFLDTKGHCFLCLQETANNSSGLSEVCLRNICRYLDINSFLIIRKSLKGDMTGQNEKEDAELHWGRSDFSVMFCSSCSSVTQSLSEMIKEMDLLKMRMKDKMKTFHGIMCQAEESEKGHVGVSRLELFQDKLQGSDCENPMEIRMVQNLRAETKLKSADRVKSDDSDCQPKLVLKPINSSVVVRNPVFETFQQHFEQVPVDPSSLDSPDRCCLCRVCKMVYPEPYIRQHLVNAHLEIFFAAKRPPTMSREAFQECCRNALSLETLEQAPVVAGPSKARRTRTEIICTFCDVKCADNMLKFHLITEHHPILEHRLMTDLQQHDIPDDVTFATSSSPEDNSSNYSDAAVRKFVADIFPNYFDKLDPSSTKSLFRGRCVCRLCKLTVSGAYARYHLAMEHPHVLFKHKQPQHLFWKVFNNKCQVLMQFETNSASRGDSERSLACPYCKLQQCEEWHLRFHLVTEHYHILEMKLVRSLEEDEPGTMDIMEEADITTNNSKDIAKNGTKSRPMSPKRSKCKRKIHWASFFDEIPHTRSSVRFKCGVCSSVHNQQGVRYHLVRKHPEKLFESRRMSHVTKDSFKKTCMEMLRMATIQTEEEKNSDDTLQQRKLGDWRCSFCSKDFIDQFHLTYHVIAGHYGRLERKLTVLQNRDMLKNKPANAANQNHAAFTQIIPEAHNPPARDPLESTNNYSDPSVRKFVTDIFPNYFEKLDKGSPKGLFYTRCICRLCGSTYTGPFARQHLVKEHVEVLFKHKRPENISWQVFNDTCRKLLQVEAASAIKTGPAPAPPKYIPPPVLCPYCTMKQSDENFLRYHLVTEHYHILEGKLNTCLQEGSGDNDDEIPTGSDPHEANMSSEDNPGGTFILPSSEKYTPGPRSQKMWKKLYQELPDTCTPNRFKCLICGSVHNIYKIRHHLAADHVEEVLAEKRDPHVSENVFRKHCVEILDGTIGRANDDKSWDAFGQERVNWLCEFCPKNFLDVARLKYHIVASHYGKIGRQLVSLQKYGAGSDVNSAQRKIKKQKQAQNRRNCATNNGESSTQIISEEVEFKPAASQSDYIKAEAMDVDSASSDADDISEQSEYGPVGVSILPTEVDCDIKFESNLSDY